MHNNSHIPVLLNEVIREAKTSKGATIVDGTLGLGGHAAALAEVCMPGAHLFGFDRDLDAISRGRTRLNDLGSGLNFVIFNESFEMIKDELVKLGVKANIILLDLGINSTQLDSSGRGFSFRFDEPLYMTMERDIKPDTLTAKEIVNTWQEESLADIIYGYGEERYARRIAKKIVEARSEKEITTTFELVKVIEDAVPASYKHGKIHFATRTFQALRIAVNDELGTLSRSLENCMEVLKADGRLLVISFHSLEDRIVKDFFKKCEDEGIGKRITKKPIVPSEKEIKENPRSRSSKLRVFEKIIN